MDKVGFVYILTNKNKTTLYVGVTNNLQRRISEHKNHHNVKSFTAKYNIEYLMYFEKFDSIIEAIAREKQIKAGSRVKKEALINVLNPEWVDLYENLF